MSYRMNILSTETLEVYHNGCENSVALVVGNKYKCHYFKPANKKERNENNREVELLGFTDSFMPEGAIIRYKDTGRRGMVNPTCLIPIE